MWEFIRNVGEISSMVEYKNQIRFSMLNSTGEVCKSMALFGKNSGWLIS
jgi:hypothetical protein